MEQGAEHGEDRQQRDDEPRAEAIEQHPDGDLRHHQGQEERRIGKTERFRREAEIADQFRRKTTSSTRGRTGLRW